MKLIYKTNSLLAPKYLHEKKKAYNKHSFVPTSNCSFWDVIRELLNILGWRPVECLKIQLKFALLCGNLYV